MYLDHKVTAKVARILEMVDMKALLLDINGNVILPEGDSRVLKLPETICQNPTMPLVYGGVTLIGTSEEQPVFICLQGDSDEIKKCAVLCAELINQILHTEMTHTSCEQSLRLMLRGEIEISDFEALAIEHSIPMKKRRSVLYFYFDELEAEAAIPMLNEVRVSTEDLVTEVGRHAAAMLKCINDEESNEVIQFAEAFENTVLTETGTHVIIGVSNPCEDILGVTDAYHQARSAVNVGRSYHPNRTIFEYRSLLLERFISEIPMDKCRTYNEKLFNRTTNRLFNEEMVHTIEVFFENSLNLSETARKLYIHRNTLVYRLEKVQKQIGLDLRNFDEAVTFKMMMLLGKNTADTKMKM